MPPIEQSIKDKIERIGTPLKEWNVKIYRGILTGYNDAFIIDLATRNELIAADPKSAEIIRPILRGRDIKRYEYNYANLYLIATFPSKKYNIEDYPAIKKHLLNFGIERLQQTGTECTVLGESIKSRKKTNNKWFETQDSIGYWDDFSKQKIVWGNLCLNAQYSIVAEEYFISAPATMIVPGNLYLLAVLNSKVADFYIRNLGVTRNGGYFEYKPMFIEKLPVPQISEVDKSPFIKLTNRILERRSTGEDSSIEESELDNLTFSLFGLTKQEIKYLQHDYDPR